MGSSTRTALCLLALLGGCDSPPEAPAEGQPAASSGGGVVIEWLDDEALAASASYHRMAARITAPRDEATTLRRVARDALVERARELGFARLDNLQIESRCDDAAPDATACTAQIMAIASR